MKQATGQCSCGAVRIAASGPPVRVGICHYRDCQRHHGAAFYAAAVFPAQAVRITGDTAHHAERHVCARCGSSVCARSGDEVEVHLGVLDDPHAFVPTYEIWTSRRLPWLRPLAGLAQFPQGRDT